MVIEGIVLRHKISLARLEVDQAKVYVIKTLLLPTTVKGIRSFLGHDEFYRRFIDEFYRRFIKDFSKISRPLCKLLKRMQSLTLMNHAGLYLNKLNPDLL